MVLNFVVVSSTSSSGSDSATIPPPACAICGAAVGRQLRAADRHHPAAVAALVAPADRARVEAAVALELADQFAAAAVGHAADGRGRMQCEREIQCGG